MIDTTRRTVIGSALALPLATLPAVPAANPDAKLLAAWERRKALLRRHYSDDADDDAFDAEFEATSTAVREAVRLATPHTPQGAAAQLRLALISLNQGADVERAIANDADPTLWLDFRERDLWRTIRALDRMAACRG